MITLIVGKKGSGKTKKLIERASQAVKNTNGNVIVIEKGSKLTYDLPHEARLIDTDAYKVSGADVFFGFVSGICAGDCVCETRTGKNAQCGNSIKKFPQMIWKKFVHIV